MLRFHSLISNHKVAITLISSSVAYFAVVKALRWRRYKRIHRLYEPKFLAAKEGKGDPLTPEEAQIIHHEAHCYDMPLLMHYATEFALFRTYAIPTISKTLAATKQMSAGHCIAKRYTDTQVIFSTVAICPMSGHFPSHPADPAPPSGFPNTDTDPRSMIALSRMNWLHSKYKISNDDYIYTLSLFVFEPVKWARKFGWREFSDMEREANFIFWVEIGRRMNMKDIPQTIDELEQFAEEYEATHMVPSHSNHVVAELAVEETLKIVPEAFGLKTLGRRLMCAFIDDRVRIAMKLPAQPSYLKSILESIIRISGFIHYHFMLPRNKPYGIIDVSMPWTARMVPTWFRGIPWYKPQSRSLIGRLVDGILVSLGRYISLPAPELRSEGYRLDELGPLKWEKEGREAVMMMAEKLLGCPIPKQWTV